MCGICGFVTNRDITIQNLKEMNDTMTHRGPDDSGEEIYRSRGYAYGMAQCRLSILDLSPLGHQPMHSSNRQVSIVFNGEIYNFKELRAMINYPFLTECDTEVLLAAYLKWGIDFLSKLNGMFAFAIYDHRDDTIILARDRIGEKPLYYWNNGAQLVFASELKPIMKYPGFSKTVRKDILSRYLFQSYINAPDTIFKDVFKLEPGHYLVYRNGKVKKHCYWNLIKSYTKGRSQIVTDYHQAKHTLNELLTNSVNLRCVADVPVGMFLSGGYDSSLITAIAQSISTQPINTFCIGFEEESMNEAEYAKEIAKHLGTNHTEHYITEAEMLDLVDSIPQYYDEPFADSSQIPTMLVSKLARQNVVVALSGDGGDEFFCGYNHYGIMNMAQLLDIPGAITNAAAKFPVGNNKKVLDYLPTTVRTIAQNRNYETKTQFGGYEYIKQIQEICGIGVSELYPVESSYKESSWQRRRMLLDMQHYLPGDILCKVDRAAMKYSLETRCPYLDLDVMEYSFALKHSFKYKCGNKKRILKDLTYDYIPKELLDRRKTGFGVPLEKWLHSVLRDRLLEYSRQAVLKKQQLFEPQQTQAFVDRFLDQGDSNFWSGRFYIKSIWSFFVFQQWYDRYIGL